MVITKADFPADRASAVADPEFVEQHSAPELYPPAP